MLKYNITIPNGRHGIVKSFDYVGIGKGVSHYMKMFEQLMTLESVAPSHFDYKGNLKIVSENTFAMELHLRTKRELIVKLWFPVARIDDMRNGNEYHWRDIVLTEDGVREMVNVINIIIGKYEDRTLNMLRATDISLNNQWLDVKRIGHWQHIEHWLQKTTTGWRISNFK